MLSVQAPCHLHFLRDSLQLKDFFCREEALLLGCPYYLWAQSKPNIERLATQTSKTAYHHQENFIYRFGTSLMYDLFIELRISFSHALISCCIMKASSWTYLMYILQTKTLRAPEFKLTTFQPSHFLS